MNKHERLEEAYRENSPRLLGWLSTKVGDHAPDVLQDVVARALGNLDALEPVRDLTAWLWRAVRNGVIDLWRSRSSRPEASEELDDLVDLVDEAWSGAADDLEEEEILEALEASIDGLPPDQRDVIIAQGLNGETFASLSDRTGVPVDTLASRKRYALAKLRRDLEDYI